MNAKDDQRPGRLPGCPPWCETSHAEPLNPMHAHDYGQFKYGTATVAVRLMWDPEDHLLACRVPRIAIVGWDPETVLRRGGLPDIVYLSSSADAEQLAGVMDLTGHPELADAIRHEAQLLTQTDPTTGDPDA